MKLIKRYSFIKINVNVKIIFSREREKKLLIIVINQQWHYRYKRNRKKELTFSEFSKSSLNAQSFSLAGNSEMEAKVRRNCSADPKGRSGLAACASCILDLSSSVGSIVNSFCFESREDPGEERTGNERRREMKKKLEKLEKFLKTERKCVFELNNGVYRKPKIFWYFAISNIVTERNRDKYLILGKKWRNKWENVRIFLAWEI